RIEVIFRLLHNKQRQRRGDRVQPLYFLRCVDRRSVIAGEEARLELSDPIVTFHEGARGLPRRVFLDRALGEATISERAACHGRSAPRPHERDRGGNSVKERSEPLHELQSALNLTLKLIECMAQGQKNGTQIAESEYGKCGVAVLFRHPEATTQRN